MEIINTKESCGEVIVKYLQKELNIPTHVKRFSVHFEINKPVVVDCTYYPEKMSANIVSDRNEC